MPRGRKADLLGSLRNQASTVLQQIDERIEQLQDEIEELRDQAATWRTMAPANLTAWFGGGRRKADRATGSTRPRGTNRVNWDEVLSSVPQRFGVEDVMKHPGAAAKGRAQVYPALNRWEATKRIKRVGKGVYEKAGGASAAQGASAPVERGSARKRAASKTPTSGKKRGRPSKSLRPAL